MMDKSIISTCSKFLSKKSKKVDWMSLPVELWLEIFKNLPQMTILFVIQQVCKLFQQLVFDSSLWKCADMNKWKNDANIRHLKLDKFIKHIDIESDLLSLFEKLYSKGFLTSTELFVPIVDRVHCDVKAIHFSRYGGDFVFGKPQQIILHKCSNLTFLNIAFCEDINTKALRNICHHCSNLKTLIMEGCSKVSDDSVKEIGALQNLKKLDISHCASITDDGINHIMLMSARLKTFLCDGVLHVTDFGIMLLVQYQNQIENISIDGEDIHDVSILSLLNHLTNLKSLEVSFCNHLTDHCLSAMIESQSRSLESLHLRKLSSKISTPVVTKLFEHSNMNLLKHLSLTDCDALLDCTLHAISVTCPLLEDIRLDWCCNVTDVGMKSVVKKCRNLSRLVLVGLMKLRGSWLVGLEVALPYLKHLDLSQCNAVDDEELFSLVKRKPDLTAYTYFHEKVDVSNVEELHRFHRLSQQTPSTSRGGEAPCPASQGATVDF